MGQNTSEWFRDYSDDDYCFGRKYVVWRAYKIDLSKAFVNCFRVFIIYLFLKISDYVNRDYGHHQIQASAQ